MEAKTKMKLEEKLKEEGYDFFKVITKKKLHSTLKYILKNDLRANRIQEFRIIHEDEFLPNLTAIQRSVFKSINRNNEISYHIYVKYK